jgi:hypothetical protein
MKTTILKFLFIGLLLSDYSCKKDVADPTVDCSTSQSRDMEGFFTSLHSGSNYEPYETMDLLTHEFTFATTSTLQICGFGYKSQGQNLIYTIELVGLYTGNLSFSSSQYEYISVPPIILNPGTYTLRRTVTNNANLSETIGPITRGTGNINPTFPVSIGPYITINSSNFYGMGGPVPNYGIPNIYFEYIKL